MNDVRLCPTCGCPCPDKENPDLCEHGHPFEGQPSRFQTFPPAISNREE